MVSPATSRGAFVTVVMAAPCVLLFFVAQRYFVQGIVMSGIKG
jgi:ABC-type glycerol-3-phosphate transport system permease component